MPWGRVTLVGQGSTCAFRLCAALKAISSLWHCRAQHRFLNCAAADLQSPRTSRGGWRVRSQDGPSRCPSEDASWKTWRLTSPGKGFPDSDGSQNVTGGTVHEYGVECLRGVVRSRSLAWKNRRCLGHRETCELSRWTEPACLSRWEELCED